MIGSYRCNCNYGYQNPFLTPTECIDYDECAESDTNNCGDNTICENLDGAYRCKCIDGFAQDSDQLSCSDIDECLIGNGGCDEISLCENTLGSRFCRCPDGFVIDENGKNCFDIDECIENAECDLSTSECRNIDGGYRCECLEGYENTDAFSCADIDECQIDNSCHEKASCSNIEGDYRCTCLSGYGGNGTHCEDIDECNDLEIVCPPRLMKNRKIIINFRNKKFNHDFSSILRSTCENIDGGHNCVCFEGFYPHQGICADVNECETGRLVINISKFYYIYIYFNNSHTCDKESTVCENEVGSFLCLCRIGFEISEVFSTCDDIDECNEGLNDCHFNAECKNIPGGFNCECKEGFFGNGTFCGDINECAANNPCDKNAACMNTDGAVVCSCFEGFEGDGYFCKVFFK